MMSKIETLKELKDFLIWDVQATECHIYPCSYDVDDSPEDPIACIKGANETVEWIKENPAYITYGEMTGYQVVIFNLAGYSCNVLF